MLKFGLKVGIASGTCYYLAEEGIWKESTESVKVYNKISTALTPYVNEALEHMSIKIPDLPSASCISYVTKQYWNAGVMNTFEFLKDLPDHTSELTKKGIDAVRKNPEVKNFLDSFSAQLPAEKTSSTPLPAEKKSSAHLPAEKM